MKPPTCYRCGSDRTHRLLTGPYVCDRCGHRFMARGTRRTPTPPTPTQQAKRAQLGAVGIFVQLSQPRGDQ